MEIGLILAIIVVSFISACKDSTFWLINISQSLTLIVAILIAFGAAQFKNDQRKVKEQIEKLIDKIQRIVCDKSFYSFETEGSVDHLVATNRMMCRKLSNCIDVLKEYNDSFDIQGDIDYLYSQYKEYNDFVSEKLIKVDELNTSESQLKLKKYSENIDSRCDRILATLYKN